MELFFNVPRGTIHKINSIYYSKYSGLKVLIEIYFALKAYYKT